jgi:hypothetical protein
LYFVDYRKNGCLISSLADNWDLDEFFERFICGSWYIYLEKTIYHLFWPIIIPSGWFFPPVVDYYPQLLNIISSSWLLFQESTIIDDIRLSWMNIVSIGWISSALDEYHPRQMSITCFSWISSARDEYHAT